MSREFKFRIYNKKSQSYVGDDDGIRYFNLIDLTSFIRANNITNLDEYIVQQSTGVKDENGVEFFEGDVIKAYYNKGAGMLYSHVAFCDGYFCEYNNLSSLSCEDEIIGTINEYPNLVVIGMREDKAIELLKEYNLEYRIISRNGKPIVMTRDYIPYRINLTIQDNIIIKAEIE